ncbi:unnamed protein product [Tuber aestivum]|uniref:Uncharacterized protein n=1 Tax=Tuber aestivum TaxID=59557 RepID=A0A292Q718_9PEZI|nr:unnamed protein product [Tuber aestivum]
MPSIHYLPTGLIRTLPDGNSEELCFVLVVDDDMGMTIATRTYTMMPATGGSRVPTHSTRFSPNADLVSSPMGMAILRGEPITTVCEQFVKLEVEEKEEKKKGIEEGKELGIPLRGPFESTGTPLLAVGQLVEEGELAYDAGRDSIVTDDYPEECVEEYPIGPPPSPAITATHSPISPHPQWLGGLSLSPSVPCPIYVSKFFPQPDVRSLTIAERRVRTRLAGEPTAGQTVRFPPERINVALAEGVWAEDNPGLVPVRGREPELLCD